MEKGRLLPLMTTFLKIGAFTFGGGYAMIPLIQKEVVERRHWVSDQDILDIIAIAESTPGPIAINAATFIGHKVAGFWGALLATLGVVLPSFAVIAVISLVLHQFEQLKLVRYAFEGIRAGVLALIIRALISMYRQCPKHVISAVVIPFAFLAVALFQWNVLLVIVACAAFGLATTMLSRRKAKA